MGNVVGRGKRGEGGAKGELTLNAISVVAWTGPWDRSLRVWAELMRASRAGSSDGGRWARVSVSKDGEGRVWTARWASRRLALSRISSARAVRDGILSFMGLYVCKIANVGINGGYMVDQKAITIRRKWDGISVTGFDDRFFPTSHHERNGIDRGLLRCRLI